MHKNILRISGITAILFGLALLPVDIGYSAEKKVEYKQSRALSLAVARQIGAVTEFLDPPEGKVQDTGKALELLRKVQSSSRRSSYDTAVMWNYFAYIYQNAGDYPKTIKAYEAMLKEPEVTEQLALIAMFSLAQLYMTSEQYPRGIRMLLRWFQHKENPEANAYALLGQAYYQIEKFDLALRNVLIAIKMLEQKSGKARENWYQIALAVYQKKDDRPNMIKYLVKLIEYFPKKIYWKQLSYMYGEMGRLSDRLAAFYMAYRQKLFNQPGEYVTLSQLLVQADDPYRGASILAECIKSGKVSKEYKHVRNLADYWRAAYEYEKAIVSLKQAAALNEKGDDYALLGSLLFMDDNTKDAEKLLERAIAKGGLKHEVVTYITLGQVREVLGKYQASLSALGKADELLKAERRSLNKRLANKELSKKARKSLLVRIRDNKKQINRTKAQHNYVISERKRTNSVRKLNEDLNRRLQSLRTRLAADS